MYAIEETEYQMKKLLCKIACGLLALCMLTGCGAEQKEPEPSQQSTAQDAAPVSSFGENTEAEMPLLPTEIRIGGLKGPTSLGLLFLQQKADKKETTDSYTFTMATAADELLAPMIKGELDIILIPANVSSILYGKTEGGIVVIDINTLGVLYMVTGRKDIRDLKGIEGETIYLTGKGTTPDYVLQYLIAANHLENVSLEYKSEATEIAAVLSADPEKIGLLPQPFVTVACSQNPELSAVLDMNEQWKQVQGQDGKGMVTGVTVVRKAFLEEHPDAVERFLKEHEDSVRCLNENTQEGAALAVEAGIIAKEQVAKKAIPYCNVTYIDGGEMRDALEYYLKVLYDLNPQSVGGNIPEGDFYYAPKGNSEK